MVTQAVISLMASVYVCVWLFSERVCFCLFACVSMSSGGYIYKHCGDIAVVPGGHSNRDLRSVEMTGRNTGSLFRKCYPMKKVYSFITAS